MIVLDLPQIQERLNRFAAQQWEKTLAYLQGQFSLSRTDCEDIFQDAFIILYKNILDGKLDDPASSLSTYFNTICKNKVYERLRGMGRELHIIDEHPETTKDDFEDERIDRLLALEDDTSQIEARKAALVREIVRMLPEPCDKILWGFYRDGFSMKTLAQMYEYKSEASVKVTKHRCSEKFRARFAELSKSFYD